MAGGSSGRSLEQTPTWAVAVVCFVLVVISIIIEHLIHLVGKARHIYTNDSWLPSVVLQWLTKRHKRALYEALEKVKSGEPLVPFPKAN
ncbi:hypothetical protein Taro_041362 [Colocasia esculenta]|uniref:Uncharacterized protein n=1 Tax=Colocasia esculenta TaxID=4460 RepID=A0A843WX38_COLES|nr:hypothetical protein [Colocasia esculenta]